jgi:hypothetical protein
MVSTLLKSQSNQFPTSLSPSSRPNDLDPWSGTNPERSAYMLLLIPGSVRAETRDLFFRLSNKWWLVRPNVLLVSVSSSSGSDWTSRYSSLWRAPGCRFGALVGLLKRRREGFGELTGLATGEPKGLRDWRRWTMLPNILTHQTVVPMQSFGTSTENAWIVQQRSTTW